MGRESTESVGPASQWAIPLGTEQHRERQQKLATSVGAGDKLADRRFASEWATAAVELITELPLSTLGSDATPATRHPEQNSGRESLELTNDLPYSSGKIWHRGEEELELSPD